MKKLLALFALTLAAGAQLVPQSLPLSWSRSDVTGYGDTNTYLAGVTYRVAGTAYTLTNGAGQSLAGLTVMVRAGDNKTNVLFYSTSTASNTFVADIQFPAWQVGPNANALRQMGVELTLADTNGVTLTYNARKLADVTLPMSGTGSALLVNGIPVTAVYSNRTVYFDPVNSSATGFVFRLNGTNAWEIK